MKYPVNEVFTTIQGEAEFTGTPSFFVRLQGCDVGCPWCDTKYTWTLENEQESIIAKDVESSAFAFMSTEEITRQAVLSGVGHVVLTGGEPATYDLTELTSSLLDHGLSVQIETSATYEINCHDSAWVTVSPKENMPGGRSVLESCVKRANEIKYPVGKQADIKKAERYKRPGVKVWLQPLSMNKKATAICVEAAKEKGFYVSAQTHKYLGLR